MHSKRGNMEIMVNDKANEIIEDLFDSLKNRYQNNIESMKGSVFVFDCVQWLYFKCREIDINRGGSYIDSPELTKNIKAAIDLINKKDRKMLSMHCNCRIKPWRNKKRSAKNNKN